MSRRGRKPTTDREVGKPAGALGTTEHASSGTAALLPRHVAIRQVLLTLICLSVGVGVHIAKGNYHPVSIALLALAAVAGLIAVAWKPRAASADGAALDGTENRARLVPLVLTVGIVVQIAMLLSRKLIPVGGEIDAAALSAAGVALAGVAVGAALCVAASLLRHRPTVLLPAGVGLMLVSHFAAGIATVQAASEPPVDVIVFQQLAAAELLDGGNPYSMTFPDLSFGTSPHYGPGLQADGKLMFGFPYPPLSLLLTSPLAIFAGDFRYTQGLAFTLTGALIAFLVPLRSSPIPSLAASLFLLTPAGPFIIASGWTEPLVALLLAMTVFMAVRKPAWLGPALGLFWAIKQYVPLTMPLALLLPNADGTVGYKRVARAILIAVVTTAVVSLPLALWDIGGFWHSAVSVQFRQPFRPDALSFLSGWHQATGNVLPSWIAFVALAAIQALALWRLPRGPGAFATAIAVSFLFFFAFSKQAFANYYFLVIAATALAVAAWDHAGETERPQTSSRNRKSSEP